jgi:ATP-dependent RNA helicase DeaD
MKLFEELSVSQPLCDALKKIGIREATPVQEQAIPALRNGRDTIVQAQTGTGKTLAFLLPLYDKIKTQADNVQTLIITPTRELTIQISKVAAILDKATGVRSLAIYGGQDIERQKHKLGRDPHVIIGTPGRILDHLRRRTLNFSTTNKIVLDEADEMLRRGFIEDVETILSTMAKYGCSSLISSQSLSNLDVSMVSTTRCLMVSNVICSAFISIC